MTATVKDKPDIISVHVNLCSKLIVNYPSNATEERLADRGIDWSTHY